VPRSRPQRSWPLVAGCVAALALGMAGCGADAATPPPVPPTPAPEELLVGVTANTLEGGLGPEQDQVRALGVRHLREELNWPAVEPERGRFQWEAFDEVVEAAAERDMVVLPVLLQTPGWLADEPTALPPAPEWGAFVGRVVRRYGSGGTFWRARPDLDATLAPAWFELWNEPYYPSFSAGGPDPERFVALQRAGVEAGRAANPEARFLLAADTEYGGRDGTARNWLADLYAADPKLNEVFDGVVSHPYGVGSPTHTDGSRRTQTLRVDDLLALLDRRGAGDRPVWITEIGWPTCPERPFCTSEAKQERYLEELFALTATRWKGRVSAVFVYHMRDFSAGDPETAAANFGLLRRDGSRKPAWGAVQRAARAAG
jgi:hypothetical protein